MIADVTVVTLRTVAELRLTGYDVLLTEAGERILTDVGGIARLPSLAEAQPLTGSEYLLALVDGVTSLIPISALGDLLYV